MKPCNQYEFDAIAPYFIGIEEVPDISEDSDPMGFTVIIQGEQRDGPIPGKKVRIATLTGGLYDPGCYSFEPHIFTAPCNVPRGLVS